MKLELNISIDLEPFTKAVESAQGLEDNDVLFHELSKIKFAKRELEALNEAFDGIEKLVKQTINDRAKASYGKDWQVIKGTGYKITRSLTGSVYSLLPEADPDFYKVKLSPNTRTIGDFVKDKGTLPKGVELNDQRSESIIITV